MEIIRIVHPSLDEYANRANAIALRNGCQSLLMLNESKIENEAERNEFSFIMRAVGDQLLHHAWKAFANTRPCDGESESNDFEPEITSGSTVLGALIDSVLLCSPY